MCGVGGKELEGGPLITSSWGLLEDLHQQNAGSSTALSNMVTTTHTGNLGLGKLNVNKI